MEIRPPETDAEMRELIRAHGLSWREAYDGTLPDAVLDAMTVDPTPEEVERWADGFSDDDSAVFVAVVDGTVRGFVDVRWGAENTKPFVDPGEAGVKAIYVHPDRWGEGIGTALLQRGLDALPDRVETVRLEAFADNDIGARFYEARGFEQVETGETEIAGETYPTAIYARDR
ncbi:ribosomal protein S18 acetylase RimI-like enzyme [Halorubrum trapanicum]|uniref:Ribosomal protein S18 acetylase RimI-like enzyme n=1 Tax=Halorubrum trapanicum TaxID=29284 RepID=A0A8J7RC46_9EURY|nr:GNAT family N-acetyltransferase [Halorubrum trapanicum]MBP1901198.1 ribosomal protein S18 acetylase RimI-like enzyme [Halorubrum trapanicum]